MIETSSPARTKPALANIRADMANPSYCGTEDSDTEPELVR
jgi:hypothetical protein